MAQVRISIRPIIMDVFSPDESMAGILTDEHATSSYGVPVAVIHGIPMGAGEISPELEIFVRYNYLPSTTPDLLIAGMPGGRAALKAAIIAALLEG